MSRERSETVPNNDKRRMEFPLHEIGLIESPFTERENCPKQGTEDGSSAWLVIDPP